MRVNGWAQAVLVLLALAGAGTCRTCQETQDLRSEVEDWHREWREANARGGASAKLDPPSLLLDAGVAP